MLEDGAVQMSLNVRAEMRQLSQFFYPTTGAMLKDITKRSTMSLNYVTKFYYAQKDNPTAETLDKLIVAVRGARKENKPEGPFV